MQNIKVPTDVQQGAGKGIYAIRDRVAAAIVGNLFTERHVGVACRAFGSLLGDKQTMPGQYPTDYELIVIGYLHEDGRIEPVPPTVVMTGESFIALNSDKN